MKTAFPLTARRAASAPRLGGPKRNWASPRRQRALSPTVERRLTAVAPHKQQLRARARGRPTPASPLQQADERLVLEGYYAPATDVGHFGQRRGFGSTQSVAGLDEGVPALSLPNLVYMENPYSHKKYQ
jgi:hypothetical protein